MRLCRHTTWLSHRSKAMADRRTERPLGPTIKATAGVHRGNRPTPRETQCETPDETERPGRQGYGRPPKLGKDGKGRVWIGMERQARPLGGRVDKRLGSREARQKRNAGDSQAACRSRRTSRSRKDWAHGGGCGGHGGDAHSGGTARRLSEAACPRRMAAGRCRREHAPTGADADDTGRPGRRAYRLGR